MGGGQPDTVTQTSSVQYNPQQQQLFDIMFPSAQEFANQGFEAFTGTGIAPFNPAQLEAQQSALTAAGTGGDLSEQAAATHSQLLDPGFMLNPNQYLQPAMEAVTGDITRNLMEKILPTVRGSSTVAGGQYSGGATRQGIAEGQAIGRTSKEISDAMTKMLLQNYQQGLQGLSTAVGQTPQVQAAQLFPSQVMSAVGSQQQQMTQAQLSEMINQFYLQQFEPLIEAQQIQGLIQGTGYPTATTTAQGLQPQANPLGQIAGLGMALLGGPMGLPLLGGSMMGK